VARTGLPRMNAREAFAGAIIMVSTVSLLSWAWRRQFACQTSSKVLVGVDVGGTSIKATVLHLDGTPCSQIEEPLVDWGFEAVCAHIAKTVEAALAESQNSASSLEGIGVCVPGLVDANTGQVLFAANFPAWPRPAPFAQSLGSLLGQKPVIDNDANAALCAELWVGAARGAQDIVMLTLGTGIGSSILCGGRLLRGANNAAGELGHSILIPNSERYSEKTGVRGILEDYASARAVGELAREALARGEMPSSKLYQLQKKGIEVTCKHVFELAQRDHDELAMRIVDQTGEYLGIAAVNIVRAFDPSMILFGGGMTRAGNFLLQSIERGFAKHYWTLSEPTCHLAFAALGPEAGAVGAAYLAHPQHLKRKH